FKDMILSAPIRKVGIRHGHRVKLWSALCQIDQTTRVIVWQRPEQHSVDNAKDGAVRANAKRKRKNCDGREAGLLQQTSRCIPNVLKYCFHDVISDPTLLVHLSIANSLVSQLAIGNRKLAISSFVSERHQGIDFRRAARRDVTSKQCDNDQQKGHAAEGQWIRWGHSI